MNEQANNELEQLIRKNIDNWVAAELKGEVSSISKLLSEDFVCIGPRGSMLKKEDWLKRFEDKILEYEKIEYNDLHIRLYDKTAIVTGFMMQKGNYNKHGFQIASKATIVFVYKNNTWVVANLQLSPLQ